MQKYRSRSCLLELKRFLNFVVAGLIVRLSFMDFGKEVLPPPMLKKLVQGLGESRRFFLLLGCF